MALSVAWIFWLSLTPLIDRDGTRFHLPFAKLWAENGFMYFRKWFAYYDLNMLNLNYLYMLVFKFGLSDQFTKIIHASFLIAGGYLIYSYFKNRYGYNWGALSFLMYVTIPIHQRLATEVYVDLGLLFFSTLSIIYFVKWLESDFTNRKYLIISSLGAGLGFGTKYNGVIFAFFMTLFVALVVSREKKDDKLAVRSMLIYGTVIFISVLPWLLRNYINSGNPLYPLFSSVFTSSIQTPPELVENVTYETAWRVVSSEDSVLSLFLLPFRVFFEGIDHDFLKFDGVLNPLLLLLLPLIFWPGIKDIKHKKILNYLFVIFLIVYLVTLYGNNIRIRYFIPVIPILIMLNIEALKNIFENKKTRIFSYLLPALFIAYNVNYGILLFNNFHLSDYDPFDPQSKEEFLQKHLSLHDFIAYINKNTPENSVIYEAFTGGRSYYIERTFYNDTASIDRYLLELAKKGAEKSDYVNHFKNLPNSTLSATHLLIPPQEFIKTFLQLNKDENDAENIVNKKKLIGFINFIKSQNILKTGNGIYLFELKGEE